MCEVIKDKFQFILGASLHKLFYSSSMLAALSLEPFFIDRWMSFDVLKHSSSVWFVGELKRAEAWA